MHLSINDCSTDIAVAVTLLTACSRPMHTVSKFSTAVVVGWWKWSALFTTECFWFISRVFTIYLLNLFDLCNRVRKLSTRVHYARSSSCSICSGIEDTCVFYHLRRAKLEQTIKTRNNFGLDPRLSLQSYLFRSALISGLSVREENWKIFTLI